MCVQCDVTGETNEVNIVVLKIHMAIASCDTNTIVL